VIRAILTGLGWILFLVFLVGYLLGSTGNGETPPASSGVNSEETTMGTISVTWG